MTETTMDRQALDELAVNTIRTLSIDGVQKANSGHPGAPMALAPLAYQLFARTMKHNPANPNWFDRDRFVLSAGHASMLLYSILHLVRLRRLAGRPQELPPVGQPDAPAIPSTRPRARRAWRSPPAPSARASPTRWASRWPSGCWRPASTATATRSWTTTPTSIASDGDMQEGVSAEASSLAGHLGLGRLIAFYDDNHVQLAGPTSMGFSEDVGARYEAYGWHVQDLGEDITLARLEEAIEAGQG